MSKTITFLISLILSITASLAQGNDVSLSGNSLNVRLFPNSGLTHPDAEGTPFLNEEFMSAKINKDSRAYNVRYNAYLDQMELEIDGKTRILKSDNPSVRIELINDEGIFETVNIEDNETRYGKLLWESDEGEKLYKIYMVNFIPAAPGNGYQRSTPSRYTDIKSYLYFLPSDHTVAIDVPGGKNKKFKVLFDSGFKKTAKEKDLNVQEESDLIQLLNMYY